MDHNNKFIDESCRLEQVLDLYDVGKLLCSIHTCAYKALEEFFGNPFSNIYVNCGTCSFFRNDAHTILCLNRAGITTIFFNIFNPPAGDSKFQCIEVKTWNLDNLMNELRKYPQDRQNMNYLLVKSSAKSVVTPDLIKKTHSFLQ